MPKGKGLSPMKRAKIVSMFNDAKLPKKEIARRLGLDSKAVRNALKKFDEGGGSSASLRDAPRSRRPPKLDDRSTRRLVRLVEQNRKKSARLLRDELSVDGGPKVSVSTIKLALKKAGLPARVAVKKPFVSNVNIEKRLKFAKEHISWTAEDWSKVLFTDESKFDYFVQRPRIVVRRRSGEKLINVWNSVSAQKL